MPHAQIIKTARPDSESASKSTIPADSSANKAAFSPLAVSIPVAARTLGVGKTSFYRLIRQGTVVPVRIGGRVVIPVAQLSALLETPREQIAADDERGKR